MFHAMHAVITISSEISVFFYWAHRTDEIKECCSSYPLDQDHLKKPFKGKYMDHDHERMAQVQESEER